MAGNVKNMGLTSLDDLFKSEEDRQQDSRERILNIPIEELHPYARQPYSVERPTPDLVRLMDSIEQVGIAEPLIVRPRTEGGYEILSGHRRDFCARVVGLQTLPVIVREYTDDEADILVVDYNITREDLLPSEKAKAYSLKLGAMKRQAGRPQKNCTQVGDNFRGRRSVHILGEQVGESATQIQRFVNLTKLIPALLEQVDNGILKVTPAADYISHLSEKEQAALLVIMERDEMAPSLGQARRLKELSDEGKLDSTAMEVILREDKPVTRKVTLKNDRLQKYFPPSYTPKQIEDLIIKLLDQWQRKKQREPER